MSIDRLKGQNCELDDPGHATGRAVAGKMDGMTSRSKSVFISVDTDHYVITSGDSILTATLRGSFALCFYDAVHESGGLVHLRSNPVGKPRNAELTDTTLSSDLLLIDRCLVELRNQLPRAQHWQARLLAQVDEGVSLRQRFEGMRDLLAAFLGDSGVALISCDILARREVLVKFDPMMGRAWIE